MAVDESLDGVEEWLNGSGNSEVKEEVIKVEPGL